MLWTCVANGLQNNDLHRFTIIVALSSWLLGAAVLIIFVVVFIAEQGWISGNEAEKFEICLGALEKCKEIVGQAERYLVKAIYLQILSE